MELFSPEIGLILWMAIPFLIVFFILAKFAWPVIIKGVEDRGKFIDQGIQSAKDANEKLAQVKIEAEQLLADTRKQQLVLLDQASLMRDNLIKTAQEQAILASAKIMEENKEALERERKAALASIRHEVAELSLQIAEQVLRKNLENKSVQLQLINQMLDESKTN
ncbi:ATP synthase subunit b [Bacteroidales bacterium]|nr:ATP synthase subunit b [Bacteroidales bacterium]